MNWKFNPPNRKIMIVAGSLLVWFFLLISPIGHIVAVLTILGWIIIFFLLGFIKVRRTPEK